MKCVSSPGLPGTFCRLLIFETKRQFYGSYAGSLIRGALRLNSSPSILRYRKIRSDLNVGDGIGPTMRHQKHQGKRRSVLRHQKGHRPADASLVCSNGGRQRRVWPVGAERGIGGIARLEGEIVRD